MSQGETDTTSVTWTRTGGTPPETVTVAEAEHRGAFVEDAISLTDAKASASDLKDLPHG